MLIRPMLNIRIHSTDQHWILSWMEENQTVTYFLCSRLFTYDIMKNFNCNISLWFFKSKTWNSGSAPAACVPLKGYEGLCLPCKKSTGATFMSSNNPRFYLPIKDVLSWCFSQNYFYLIICFPWAVRIEFFACIKSCHIRCFMLIKCSEQKIRLRNLL
jgi:hypothetical protein